MAGITPNDERGVYAISMAAELVGLGEQTLRLYEARGLLQPDRTEGGTRRYSANDLTRLRRIADLLDAGLNLAGISMVLDLEVENTQLRADQLRADQLRADQLRAEKEEQPWPTTASTPARKSPKQTSSNSRPRSIRN